MILRRTRCQDTAAESCVLASLFFSNKRSSCTIHLHVLRVVCRAAHRHLKENKKETSSSWKRITWPTDWKKSRESMKSKGRAVAAAAQQPSPTNAHNLLTHIAKQAAVAGLQDWRPAGSHSADKHTCNGTEWNLRAVNWAQPSHSIRESVPLQD